jgi:hypothetical protein
MKDGKYCTCGRVTSTYIAENKAKHPGNAAHLSQEGLQHCTALISRAAARGAETAFSATTQVGVAATVAVQQLLPAVSNNSAAFKI